MHKLLFSLRTLEKSFVVSNNFKSDQIFQTSIRFYAAKGKVKTLSEAELQAQKHASEMQYKEKTSLVGKPFDFKDAETSMKYMESDAYKLTYGEGAIWKKYARSYGTHRKPQWTRKMCIRRGLYGTGNPCPICRDEFLVVDYKNLKLLKQFLAPSTGELYSVTVTNVCQRQQKNLEVAYTLACDHGLIEHDVPFREYDYSLYYTPEEMDKSKSVEDPSMLLKIVLAANKKKLVDLRKLTDEDIREVK